MLRSVVSKAADKCKRASRETFPALNIFRSAMSVLLKVTVEVVSRDVRRAEKEPFFQ